MARLQLSCPQTQMEQKNNEGTIPLEPDSPVTPFDEDGDRNVTETVDAEITVHDDEEDDDEAEFHDPNNVQVDYSSQPYGICFWLTIAFLTFALLAVLIISPVMGLLALLSIVPALGIFITIFILKRKSISMDLLFKMFWSGMLSVIGIFIIELAMIITFLFIFVGIGLISLPQPQPDDPTYIVKLLRLADFSFFARVLFTLFQSFVVASLIEETTKYFLVYRVSHGSTSNQSIFFNAGPESAMIYSAVAALGLATLENVGYVLMSSYADTKLNPESSYVATIENGVLVALARSMVAIPVHVLTGALIGLNFYKYSNQDVQRSDSPVRFKFLRVIAVPFIVHGIYDFVLMSTQAVRPDLVMFAFAFASVVVMAMILIVWREYYILNQRWRLATSASVLRDVVVDDDSDQEVELQQMIPSEKSQVA